MTPLVGAGEVRLSDTPGHPAALAAGWPGGGTTGPGLGRRCWADSRAPPDTSAVRRGRTGSRVHGVVGIDSLVAVSAVALLAPLTLGLLPRLLVPQVVLLLVGGMVIGPQVLGLGTPGDVQILADVGLGFVFLLAGYEVDLRLFGQD